MTAKLNLWTVEIRLRTERKPIIRQFHTLADAKLNYIAWSQSPRAKLVSVKNPYRRTVWYHENLF